MQSSDPCNTVHNSHKTSEKSNMEMSKTQQKRDEQIAPDTRIAILRQKALENQMDPKVRRDFSVIHQEIIMYMINNRKTALAEFFNNIKPGEDLRISPRIKKHRDLFTLNQAKDTQYIKEEAPPPKRYNRGDCIPIFDLNELPSRYYKIVRVLDFNKDALNVPFEFADLWSQIDVLGGGFYIQVECYSNGDELLHKKY